jgi:5-methylcytosine-specific restriction enzyme A
MTYERSRWQKLYSKQRWTNRSKYQLHAHPLCAMCLQSNIIKEANVADHIVPHHGDPQLFWFGALQSLCWAHHNSSKKQIENKGYINDIGADGFPVDAEHPFNKVSKSTQ